MLTVLIDAADDPNGLALTLATLVPGAVEGLVRDVVVIDRGLDAATRKGFATLPHGYGMRYRGAAPNGPHLNLLTSSEHCDPMTYTPYHKYVPISIRPCAV